MDMMMCMLVMVIFYGGYDDLYDSKGLCIYGGYDGVYVSNGCYLWLI